jgi:hypothetical protein
MDDQGSRLRAEPWRAAAVVMALACAVVLLIDSSTSDVLILTLGFALLYIAGAFLAGRSSWIGLILLAVLFTMDFAFVPFYERSSIGDWLFQGSYALFNLVGLIATIVVLVKRRRVRSRMRKSS